MPRQKASYKELSDRFWSKVRVTDTKSCWLWMGSLRHFGYGQFWYNERSRPAHRFAYENAKGKIPDGKIVMHTCDVPACVNPYHLRLGTYAENSADMALKRRSAAGEKNGSAKLKRSQIKEIRALYELGHPQSIISEQFGVSQAHISKIVLGQAWS
jgi:HNH endonuclease